MSLFKDIKLIGGHIAMGLLVYMVPFVSNLYLIGIFIFFFFRIVKANEKKRTFEILIACGYVVGAEVFLRMTGGSILYEASKYIVAFFCLLGLMTSQVSRKSFVYIFYILLLVPSVFLAGINQGTDTVIRKAIVFNLSGPVCLGIVAIFCYGKSLAYINFQRLLFVMALPLISITTYLFLYTPSIKNVINSTGSNFATSGGFGPNQVATVLGIGMFVFTVRFFLRSPSKFHNIINVILLGLISFRGIVTFSRGGIFVAFLMIASFLFLYFKKSNIKNKKRIAFLISLFIILGFSIWMYSSIQTKGFIGKRYNNEDALGREKKDISTGRTALLSIEFDAFLENPIFGVGVGKSREYRYEKTGVMAASHNEMSRILSEHGLFGFFGFSILFIMPLIFRIKDRSNIFFYSFYLFWFLTINHSAMRIAAPAFIYGLCLLKIKYEKPTVHRKSIASKR